MRPNSRPPRSVALFCLCIIAAATHSAAQENKDRVERWREDVRFLETELPQRHKNLFFQLPQSKWQEGIESIRQQIPTLTDNEVQMQLCRLVASVGDGHTRIYFQEENFELFPVQFMQFRDGLYVTAAAAEFEKHVGSRLLAINDTPTREVFQKLSTILSHDNDSYLGYIAPKFLNYLTLLDSVGVTQRSNSTAPAKLTLSKDDETVAIDVPRYTVSQMNRLNWVSARKASALYQQNDREDYWTRWLPESKTYYLKYRRCNGVFSFASQSLKIMNFIKDNDVARIVVDMRLNGGGNSMVMMPLLGTLKGSELNHPSRMYVVIGRRTFSSAVLNAIAFKQSTNATLVGLPTGGKPNHFGEVKTMKLPNSRLIVQYSTNYFEHFRAGDPDSLVPDVEIGQTFSNWSTGADAVLDYIVERPVKSQSNRRPE